MLRVATQRTPDLAEAWCNLAHALGGAGQHVEALAAMERGHQLGSARSGWQYPSAEWLDRCRFFATAETRWEGWRRDGTVPEALGERQGMAKWALARGDAKLAMKLLEPLLDEAPEELASMGLHIDVSRASMLLAATEPAVAAAHLVRAREQLAQHIAAMHELVTTGAGPREALLAHLRDIAADEGFATVRDAVALAAMAPPERAAWQQVWQALQAAIAAAGG